MPTDLSRYDDDLSALAERAHSIVDRANEQRRDFTAAEAAEMRSIRTTMENLRDTIEAAELADQVSARVSLIDDALHTRSAARFGPGLLVGETNLRSHWEAIVKGGTHSAEENPRAIETRARVTAATDIGSASAWSDAAPNAPRNLIAFAGMPISELTGKTAQVPVFTAPVSALGADEGANHPEYDDVAKTDLTALRYGRWTDVSSVVAELDDLRGVNQMHAWGIAHDLDRLALVALQTSAGVPSSAGSDLEGVVRQLLLTVAASTYSDETQLVITGRPVELARLTGITPANGSDLASVATRFNGARLYPSLDATASVLTVFAPNAFRVFQTPLRSATTIDPASGAQKFGSWLHSTPPAQQITGSALSVTTSGS
ncbi:MAG: hypothetical protein HZB45_10175 [Mycolicibacterium rufum]|nr:hypothetical protein [Mycolicibacterium rufum]